MQQLRDQLAGLDGRGYKAYKALAGTYRFPRYTLCIDHVQGDPFAEPSRIRVQLAAESAQLPAWTYANPVRIRALEDYLGRSTARAIAREVRGDRGSGHSGEIRIARHGQQVLKRDAIRIQGGAVEARLGLALPAAGRRILAAEAETMLFTELPAVVEQALLYPQLDPQSVQRHLHCVEDQSHLRAWLGDSGLVGFIADGSMLARRSGVDDRPLADAIGFEAPAGLALQPTLPHAGPVRGMGLARGISLIVGGGFNGKSTLLQALQLGVYDHIPGDGRERVVCEPTAMKIRAEDGRAINDVDISGFIDHLPFARDTVHFTTANASGSTSQAANIIEALAGGSRTLLIDEDTSATNFMLRDARMQRLVTAEKEPITPLIERVRELYEVHGASSVIVTGGSSAFIDVADRVIMMDAYRPCDLSARARDLADSPPPRPAQPLALAKIGERILSAGGRLADPRRTEPRVQAFAPAQIRLGEWRLPLERVEQIVDPGQLLAIGHVLRLWLAQDTGTPVLPALRLWLQRIETQGLDCLSPYPGEAHGGLAAPRLQEVFAAINRLRELGAAV